MTNTSERCRTTSVRCARCGAETEATIPSAYRDPTVTAQVALFDERTAVDCENGHRFYVYDC